MELISYKSIHQTWRVLSNQGVQSAYPPDQAKNIRVANQSSFISCLLTLISVIYLTDIGPASKYHLVFILFSILFLTIILCNSLNYHRLAKLLPFLIGALIIFWASYAIGYNSHVHFAFVYIILGIALNFGKGSWQFFFLIISLCTLLIGFLFLSGFSFEPSHLSPEIQKKISYLSFASCIIATVIFSSIYIRNQNKLRMELLTAQQHLEQKNNELEKRNLELDKFVYRISHDLRAPIASVMGLVNLSKKETNNHQIADYLNLQEVSLKKLDNYITELVYYSYNNKLEIQYSHIELAKLIDEIFDQCALIEKAEKLKKFVTIRQNSEFITDRERLKLILNNLITHAIYYSNPYIEEPFVKIEAETGEHHATIKVSDNGMGIAQEHMNKIFHMFHKGNGNGNGLGLYIAKEAVEKLKGTIQVCSELGKGTEFTIYLPSCQGVHLENQS